MILTTNERKALLAIVRGAQDDDDWSDNEYTLALASLVRKAQAEAAAEAKK
jgi:hypothetical protein